MTKHIRHQSKVVLFTDRTERLGFGANIGGSPDEFRMGVADLIPSQAANPNLVDQHPPGKSMVDDASSIRRATKAAHREICRRHGKRIPVAQDGDRAQMRRNSKQSHHTGPMSGDHRTLRLGTLTPDQVTRRIIGDPAQARRVLELGIGPNRNALVPATLGVKAIAVDPNSDRLTELRQRATELDVVIECHLADLADLGFATSSSVDLVIADGTLDAVEDLARVLRQVHRVLQSGRPLVLATRHPFDGVGPAEPTTGQVAVPYGQAARTIGDWFDALRRANFDVDLLREFGVGAGRHAPHTLVIRAHKLGD